MVIFQFEGKLIELTALINTCFDFLSLLHVSYFKGALKCELKDEVLMLV
jgi:hypothetical protein